MKKLLCFILVSLLVSGLFGCKNKEENTKTNKEYSSSELNVNEEKAIEIKSDSQYNEQYIGNKNTKIFHISTCHTLPEEKNQIYFDTWDEASEQNFKPCKNCMP